jgi:CheY-like chemotaxis protein
VSDTAVGGVLSAEAMGELRHELRTPLNLVIGYSEMLLEDAVAPEHAGRRQALSDTLAAGRELLELINGALAASRSDVGARELELLYEQMRAPQARILGATVALLDAGGGASDQFETDVRRIRAAAERLLVAAREEPRRHLTQGAAVGAPPDAALSAPTGELPVMRRSMPARILVVDDVEDNRSVLERRLVRQGHTVTCASGGRAALELVDRATFDLVLLDVRMPDLDGYAVLERLKSSPGTRDIPVIMITALDDMASVVRCIERGAEDHLTKPFDPVLLGARIGACLEKKRLRDAELEYLDQVSRVIEAATAVEAGSYQTGALARVAQRADELGRLARVFDGMAAQVRAREERLKEQVTALRGEIDAARSAERPAQASGEPHGLATGAVFAGRYEIVGEIGSGGMGMVYRAIDRQLGEVVAVKTLRPEMVTDTAALERFKSEIRLARHITDRHVVRTHDIGESDGVYYLTMEYVEGITVRELLDTRGRLGVPATLAIAAQLARSLVAAHEQGVIHRDIKPENLLLDAGGVLKVMDFGVARLAEGVSSMTMAGFALGTPAYMAPEQLLAEQADARSDLYAAGVVMYECLTGTRPFDGGSPFVLIARVLKDEPVPPSTRNAEVPPALEELILRLLAKEPADRPATAAELARFVGEMG